jgi:hypothetical protein
MRQDQYLNLLGRLHLKPHSRRCAAALGLSVRQAQRIAAGEAPVPRPVAMLVIAYTKLGGVPDQLWDPDRHKTDLISEAMQRAEQMRALKGLGRLRGG